MAFPWMFKIVCLLILVNTVVPDKPCIPRLFGADRIVCVCNATYCDTVDEVSQLPTGQYVQYTSNRAGKRFEKTTGSFEEFLHTNGVHLKVQVKSRYQTIFGFGGAFTDAAGINIKSLSPQAQENLLKSYFSPQGIELNFGRVPIAGSDFSTRTYTYDDVPNDSRLQYFNLTVEDYSFKIPVIKRALQLSKRNIHLIGAAWSAPPWMKTNNDYSGFGFLKEEYFEAWANYLIKFLDFYKREGLIFWGISTGNEPSNGIIPINRFNSMGWTPITQLQWVRENLGPTIRASQHNLTKILALDDQRFMLPWWFESMKTDHQAAQYIDGIAVHWYWDTYMPPSLLDRTHNNFPDKFILATEACVGDKPWEEKVIIGSWQRGELYMQDIIQDLSHWVAGWIDWNLALSPTGGPNWAKNFVDAAVLVNATADEFYKQPMFYALGHFAKFVTEGAVRVAIKPITRSKIDGIAFLTTDKAVVIILYNKKNEEVRVTISDPDRGHLNLVVSPLSFQTIIYW